MVYNIILVSAILGIVGWCYTRPVDEGPGGPIGQGIEVSLVVNSFEWSHDGTSASIEVVEMQDDIILRTHSIVFKNNSFMKIRTEEREEFCPELIRIRGTAHFNPQGTSFVIIYYDQAPGPGQDPGLHFTFEEGDSYSDITPGLRAAVMG
jgi:hypothetical protein